MMCAQSHLTLSQHWGDVNLTLYLYAVAHETGGGNGGQILK